MNKHFYPLFAVVVLLLNGVNTYAQDYYTVSIGQFVNVQPQNFAKVRPLGFLYQQTGTNGLPQVFLGQFSDEAKAEQASRSARATGFTNAQVVSGKAPELGNATVIQIATRYTNRGINWSELSRVGSLNVQLNNEVVKVFTGTFPDATTAKQALPAVQALGYTDAFIKTVPIGQLLPVTPLATGIKEDLIPLNLADRANIPAEPTPSPIPQSTVTPRSPVTTPAPAPSVPRATAPNPAPRPTDYSTAPSGRAIPSTSTAAAAPSMPIIRADVKRNSALELQRVLQSQGFYDSGLDGYYGQGTTSAYEAALRDYYPLRKYQSLTPLYAALGAVSNDDFLAWPEVQLLREMVLDVNPPARQAAYDWQRANARRQTLYTQTLPISANESVVLENWHKDVTQNITRWGQTDAFLGETATALQIVYWQTLVRLEDYFMDRNFDSRGARALALASLRAIAGVGLVKFQSS